METIEELQAMIQRLTTELHQARKAQAQAEAANQNKSIFLANMSHEVRTPLNVITGFSKLLVSESTEEERKMFAEVLEANCTLLLELINDILDLSKVESGVSTLEKEELDLNMLMKELSQMMCMRILNENVELNYIPSSSSYCIWVERKSLTQILINLLANALKFTEKGEINFGYERRDDMLYFYVVDTGCGIPSSEIHHVFERFVRLDTAKVGTGLGLAICKALVERMGGHIGVNSELGKGSEFWFTIPFCPIGDKK